jgi:hypothetical protein
MTKHFTLRQANAALSIIKPLLEEVLSLREAVLALKPEIWPVIEHAAGNGGSQVASKLAFEFNRIDELIHKIQDTGVILKDLNSGLLDFLSKKGKRDIYLCWQYGEEKIAFWHEIEAGYAGRQAI